MTWEFHHDGCTCNGCIMVPEGDFEKFLLHYRDCLGACYFCHYYQKYQAYKKDFNELEDRSKELVKLNTELTAKNKTLENLIEKGQDPNGKTIKLAKKDLVDFTLSCATLGDASIEMGDNGGLQRKTIDFREYNLETDRYVETIKELNQNIEQLKNNRPSQTPLEYFSDEKFEEITQNLTKKKPKILPVIKTLKEISLQNDQLQKQIAKMQLPAYTPEKIDHYEKIIKDQTFRFDNEIENLKSKRSKDKLKCRNLVNKIEEIREKLEKSEQEKKELDARLVKILDGKPDGEEEKTGGKGKSGDKTEADNQNLNQLDSNNLITPKELKLESVDLDLVKGGCRDEFIMFDRDLLSLEQDRNKIWSTSKYSKCNNCS